MVIACTPTPGIDILPSVLPANSSIRTAALLQNGISWNGGSAYLTADRCKPTIRIISLLHDIQEGLLQLVRDWSPFTIAYSVLVN